MRLVHQKILRITPVVPSDRLFDMFALMVDGMFESMGLVLRDHTPTIHELGEELQRKLKGADKDGLASVVMNQHMETVARRSYKSWDKMSPTSYHKFLDMIRERGHGGVFEHGVIYVEILTDRGVTHELVRHRIASYLQESTRYCDYNDGHVEFVVPVELEHVIPDGYILKTGTWDRFLTVPGASGNTNAAWYDAADGEELAFWDKMHNEEDSNGPMHQLGEDTADYLDTCTYAEQQYKRIRSRKNADGRDRRKAQYARGCLPNWLKTEVGMTINLRSLRNFLELRTAKAAHPQFRPLAQKILDYCKQYYPEVVEDIS